MSESNKERIVRAARGVSCEQAKRVALRVLEATELAGLVALAGGVLPWLVSGRDSGRLHGDVDMMVWADAMPAVRRWLDGQGVYARELDARFVSCNTAGAEFGQHAVLDGVLLSFCPFTLDARRLVQRSAAMRAIDGYDALFETVVEGIDAGDYLERRALGDGAEAGCMTVEACRAVKMVSARDKDAHDCAEIDRMGYDVARYDRLARAFSTMTIRCVAHSV